MSKKKHTKKAGWTSLEAEAKRLKGRLKRIDKLRDLLPEEILSDSKALIEWLRKTRNQKKHKPAGANAKLYLSTEHILGDE